MPEDQFIVVRFKEAGVAQARGAWIMNPAACIRMLALGLLLSWSTICQGAEIETVAGTGAKGYSGDGRKAMKAKLNQPFGVIIGPEGDLFFCDTNNHVIRRVGRDSGEIETVVGCGKKGYAGDGGAAKRAKLNEPYEVRFHPNGDLYWVERMNHVVRRLDRQSGEVQTVAGTGQAGFSGDGGPGSEAAMNQPHSIQFDEEGRFLFICDIRNHRVRRLELSTGILDTWCGTGKATGPGDGARVGKETPLKGPRALDRGPDGDLWLALREGNAVFRISMEHGTLHHVAGTGKAGFTGNGGPAIKARLSGPKGLAISRDGQQVYLADTESHTVRVIDLSQSPPGLRLVAGDGSKGDGPDSPDPLKCRMNRLHSLCIDPANGDLYIGDSGTHKVRVIRGLGGE